MHERFVGEAKEREADVVFIGDSLIQVTGRESGWTDGQTHSGLKLYEIEA